MQLSISQARALIKKILVKAGADENNASAMVDTIVAGEIDGCRSHGLWRTLGCVSTLKKGKAYGHAQPTISEPSASLVRVDAKGGFSPLAFRTGLPLLIEKAKRQGIAAMAINHCVHFSALWIEIEQLTEAELVAFAFTPSHSWVAPFGGSTPIFGTNPMAFGWPRPTHHPYVFDFATSEVARGEIQLHQREGKPVPNGWGVDRNGEATTNAQEILENGAMLPFGGHKGSALAAMVELIAGPLIGDLMSAESLKYDEGTGASPYHGELIIAIDPASFLGKTHSYHIDRAEILFNSIMGQGARLPSQRRYAAREESLKYGLDIPDSLYQELVSLA